MVNVTEETDVVRGCGTCDWCGVTHGRCPHGYACCLNCGACEMPHLRAEARKEAEFIRSLDLEAGYPELTAALDRMMVGWR